ncbi:DUF2171 domain-containing protein [Sphingomonas kyeonggiensis]|uniref:DUF2171 domain-containing protein n=1 Tax=Sphingomonas kyeonggiensis TaxID=1268553 RepID=A0A7W6JXM1_9SPHN|nr:DUF2171 domain-containing protein [Sphingomonas kyeonggiensis]MBB4101459.1 hypothetical protein [Sphingomonas kyeonggiensis]
MNDRYTDPRYFGPEDQYQVGGARRAGGEHYSSAREYAAAGELGRGRGQREGHGAQSSYGHGGHGNDWDRGARDYRGARSEGDPSRGYGAQGGYDRHYRDNRGDGHDADRGFLDRAGDEVRSWFGDREAERRREEDMRYDTGQARSERWAQGPDDHYGSWRRERIAELDKDYDEYRRENAQRFQNEFNTWRTDRQGQRDAVRRVSEHMEVIGSDGSHVGTVDKVRGDRIILTKNDTDAGGHHHSIPSRWVQSVDDKVTLRKTADEAQAAWKDEERSGALFGGRDDQDWSRDRNLNRSFPGTY